MNHKISHSDQAIGFVHMECSPSEQADYARLVVMIDSDPIEYSESVLTTPHIVRRSRFGNGRFVLFKHDPGRKRIHFVRCGNV